MPRAIPRLNRLAGGAASQRERVAESFDVFASPRLVRFEEMEYALPRERAAEAVRAAREILERHPVSFPIELRFSAGDDALLSPAHGRDSAYVAVHVFEGMEFEAPFREVEAVMRELGRPAALGEALVPRRRGARAALPALGRLRRDPRAARSRGPLRQRLGRAARCCDLRPALDPDGRLRVDRGPPHQRRGAERRARGDRGRPRRVLHRPPVGAERLLARARGLPAHGRLARRPVRPQEAVRDRRVPVHGRVGAVRARAVGRAADRARGRCRGSGAAVMFPSSLALLAQEFEGEARARAIGIWGAVIGLAFAAGPLVGGVLVDAFGWQAIFALGVVLGLPTIALALTKVGESRDPDPSPIDWPGRGDAVARALPDRLRGAARQRAGVDERAGARPGRGGAVSLAAFARVELRAADPMLDLRLFRNRTFLGATVIVATLAGGSFGVFVYLSLFLLDVGGGSPVEVGLWLAPLALFAFASSLLAGRLAGRVPLTAALAVGMGLCAGGLLLMTGIDADSSWLHLLAGLSVVGIGTGLANPMVDLRPPRRAAAGPGRARVGDQQHRAPARAGGRHRRARRGAADPHRRSGRAAHRRPRRGARRGHRPDRRRRRRRRHAARAGGRARQPAHAPTRRRSRAGLNELLLISVVLALIGLAAALVLVRTRDLWRRRGQTPHATLRPGV